MGRKCILLQCRRAKLGMKEGAELASLEALGDSMLQACLWLLVAAGFLHLRHCGTTLITQGRSLTES